MMAKPTSVLGFSWATPVINTTTLVPSLTNTSMNIKKLPSKNAARKAPNGVRRIVPAQLPTRLVSSLKQLLKPKWTKLLQLLSSFLSVANFYQ